MAEGMTAAVFGTAAIFVGYATWWLIRHELAVRRLRAQPALSARIG